jgi:hypothetical protein
MSVRTTRSTLPHIFSRAALMALTFITLLLMQSACSLGGGGGYAGLYQGTSTLTETVNGQPTTETSQGLYYILDGTESDLVIVMDGTFQSCPLKAKFDGEKFESKKVRCTIAGDTTITGTLEVEGELVDGDLELEGTFNGTVSGNGQNINVILAQKFDGKRK